MKITKFIPLVFAGSPNTTARISIPFRVKTIHVKSMSYVAATDGVNNYVCVMSDLFPGNSPFGIVNQDTTYSSGSIQDIELQFANPIDINATYTFNIINMDGSTGATSNGGINTDWIGMIVEFNSADEIF